MFLASAPPSGSPGDAILTVSGVPATARTSTAATCALRSSAPPPTTISFSLPSWVKPWNDTASANPRPKTVPSAGKLRGWLAELDLPPVSREIVTDCLAFIDALAPAIDRIDGELRRHAKADPRVKVLTALPGVGQFTALVMLAEIGDITRFPSARKLASWAGLTPTVRGSDLTVRHGHTSKQGSAWLRWVLNQAAQTTKRSPEFSATYAAIAKRRGKKIATTAIARKLLTRAYHLLATAHATQTSTPADSAARAAATAPQTGGSPSPGHARPCGMSRPPGCARSFD